MRSNIYRTRYLLKGLAFQSKIPKTDLLEWKCPLKIQFDVLNVCMYDSNDVCMRSEEIDR